MIDLKRHIASQKGVANLPAITLKVLEILGNESATLQDLAEVIKTSPSLTAKILKVVNCSSYAFNAEISNITQAMSILGLKAVANIALSVSVIDGLRDSLKGVELSRYWEKSLFSAVAGKLLAERLRIKETEECFISGLLSNISELFLAQNFPDEYHELTEGGRKESDRMRLEWEHFGMTHAEISGLILRCSKIPPILLKPIELHHTRHAEVHVKDPRILKVCQVAYCAAHIATLFYEDSSIVGKLRDEVREILELDLQDFETMLTTITTEVKAASEYFGFGAVTFPTYFEILERANRELSKINLSYEELLRQLQSEKEKSETLAAQLEDTNRKLLELALRDPLTGAYNRRFLNEMLDKQMADARRYGHPLFIILGDIDHFKRINDTHGHTAGDLVLRKLVGLIQNTLRGSDILARTGGEEFVVVCHSASLDDGVIVAERLRARIAATPIKLADGRPIQVTMSFGVAGFDPAFRSRDEFIKIADRRLYAAKNTGRNRVVYLDPAPLPAAARPDSEISDLPAAVG